MENLSIYSILSDLKSDPKMGSFNLSIASEPAFGIQFILWNNPQENEEWRNSGYTEGLEGDFSGAAPMPVLAIIETQENWYVYKLTPEEKYNMIVFTDENGIDPIQLLKVNSIEDFKKAFFESLWEME
jgi:hypothetical protein